MWCVVVTKDDEPPLPPIVTGVFGPMTEGQALDFALCQNVEDSGVKLLVTPLERPKGVTE